MPGLFGLILIVVGVMGGRSGALYERRDDYHVTHYVEDGWITDVETRTCEKFCHICRQNYEIARKEPKWRKRR